MLAFVFLVHRDVNLWKYVMHCIIHVRHCKQVYNRCKSLLYTHIQVCITFIQHEYLSRSQVLVEIFSNLDIYIWTRCSNGTSGFDNDNASMLGLGGIRTLMHLLPGFARQCASVFTNLEGGLQEIEKYDCRAWEDASSSTGFKSSNPKFQLHWWLSWMTLYKCAQYFFWELEWVNSLKFVSLAHRSIYNLYLYTTCN